MVAAGDFRPFVNLLPPLLKAPVYRRFGPMVAVVAVEMKNISKEKSGGESCLSQYLFLKIMRKKMMERFDCLKINQYIARGKT